MVGIIFNFRLRDVLSDLENQIGISLIPSKLTYIGKVKIQQVKTKKNRDKEKYPVN